MGIGGEVADLSSLTSIYKRENMYMRFQAERACVGRRHGQCLQHEEILDVEDSRKIKMI